MALGEKTNDVDVVLYHRVESEIVCSISRSHSAWVILLL